ncbi:hypothetical protein H0176_24180 [Methylorubrum populi]|uniref:Uncharacterized protein n=1 Tax=Methylorubrum rhodesianum TaxID=29427 RepID=A0ABU9Z5I2_9HYPH|nr:hypothetical protein [Methylorubrum rhodesianum]MBK3403253.1 hypothetical protein [Methylorubrum rhodesianum]MBY0143337.1 hypothetical protein [Methylorubrum populi]
MTQPQTTAPAQDLDLSFDLNLAYDDLDAAASNEPCPHALDALLAQIADAEIRDLPLPEVLLPF